MSDEKRKVNSGAAPETDGKKAIDEIVDGFYDLSQLYSSKPKKQTPRKPADRAEELRLREERRRELEMQAIKEDIERRYSIQYESAQKKAEAEVRKTEKTVKKPIISLEIDDNAVDEELSRIDELINDETVGGVTKAKAEIKEEPKKKRKRSGKKKAEKKLKPEKEEPAFELSETNSLYYFIYILGDMVCRGVSKLSRLLFGIVLIPLMALQKSFGKAAEGLRQRISKYFESTVNEIKYFRKEIKSARKSIRKAMKKPLALPSVLIHYVKKAFVRHRKLLKTAINTALPVASFALLIITVNYWNSVTFALEVIYNDTSIGYISDETVYIEAKELVKDRLSSGAYDGSTVEAEVTVAAAQNLNADYQLTLVSLDELNDARIISDKIIENSVDNLTNACGVYIDGDFICAVKNEADAKTVFYNILAPYEKDAEEGGYVVGFAQDIDYVQGLYSDNETVMWDAAKLTEEITNPKQGEKKYTVDEGDSLSSIAEDLDVSEDYLVSLNPDYDFDGIQPGDEIVTERATNYVGIKKIVTTNEIREIEYETVKQKDSSKYSGYSSVTQEGVNGTERVTKTYIYIDGELVDTEYDYETLREPVDKIMVVGTKTTYDGVYVGSASEEGFLWPAPSCHRVSSPYGWRSSGWHNGIDLVRAGGGANGTPVIASRSGRVEVVQRSNSGYGNMVLINHGDGYKTRYAHMISGSITVSVGEYVEAGQTIGKVGSTGNSTGPHLHFEVIYNGETYDPKNYIY